LLRTERKSPQTGKKRTKESISEDRRARNNQPRTGMRSGREMLMCNLTELRKNSLRGSVHKREPEKGGLVSGKM